jgi:hypothetical protein
MYCDMIKDVPLNRLKYLDESHFASRGVCVCVCVCACIHTASTDPRASQSCDESAVLAPRGQPVYATNNDSLADHYAVTLMMIGLHDANVQQNPVSSSIASTA